MPTDLSTEFLLPQALKQTLIASDYAGEVLQKYNLALKKWSESGYLDRAFDRQEILGIVTRSLSSAQTEQEWMQLARQLRHLMMFRLIWQDANAKTDVVRLTQELSDFTDIMIQQAVQYAKQSLIGRYGEPIGRESGLPQELVVIGMGKLGAHELNLSSDIDLIFVYDEKGESNGRKSIDNQEYMIQWGQKVIRLLDQVTEDGFVFRVDMRLRPWGDGSALAISEASLEQYLAQNGREWERYAWIKARAITGGKTGENIISMTRPFVFRRYIDFSVFQALRELKEMIEKEVIRRKGEHDIKLGAGGIREIEFIVQALQLIYGGAIKSLRGRNCLLMLDELHGQDLLPEEQVEELKSAYLFLRRLEHAIQALNDHQTQNVPTDPILQQRIAQAMSYKDWASLLAMLDSHRQKVKKWFAEVVSDRRQSDEFSAQDHLPVDQLLEQFEPNVADLVRQFLSSRQVERLPEESRHRLNLVLPLLLHAITKVAQKDRAVQNLIPLLENILRRSVYLVLLLENPGALQRLVEMLSHSPWISQELARYPVLLDEFLSDPLTDLPDYQSLDAMLRQQLLRVEVQDEEDLLRTLRLFKKSAVLSIAALDILIDYPIMKISDALTVVGEVVLKHTLQHAWKSLYQRYGAPVGLDGQSLSEEASHFAIIGYGKLGGLELSYGSDLDLVFLHDINEQALTSGPKQITGLEFITKLAQKMMSLLSTQTLDGRVYEIDTRLRPSGEAGLLVTSINAFDQYQQHDAWVWEHQALVRARAVAGDQKVINQFIKVRKKILSQKRDLVQLRKEVQEMRNKMIDHLGSDKTKRQEGKFHIKHDPGGMVDIEFLNQYAVLGWAHEYPELLDYSDNIQISNQLAKIGLLNESQLAALQKDYLALRKKSHQLALQNDDSSVDGGEWENLRGEIRKIWREIIETEAE